MSRFSQDEDSTLTSAIRGNDVETMEWKETSNLEFGVFPFIETNQGPIEQSTKLVNQHDPSMDELIPPVDDVDVFPRLETIQGPIEQSTRLVNEYAPSSIMSAPQVNSSMEAASGFSSSERIITSSSGDQSAESAAFHGFSSQEIEQSIKLRNERDPPSIMSQEELDSSTVKQKMFSDIGLGNDGSEEETEGESSPVTPGKTPDGEDNVNDENVNQVVSEVVSQSAFFSLPMQIRKPLAVRNQNEVCSIVDVRSRKKSKCGTCA